MNRFSPDVARELRHYVYVYVDPDTDEVFYVGKGRGDRAFFHLDDTSETEKCARVRAIRARGREPIIEILAHGLPDEASAYRVEAAAIDLLGIDQLTNVVRGWRSGTYGRMTVEQVEALYGADEIEIIHPAILIRINRRFRYGMAPIELYDATRGIWRVGARREQARFALAVFEGVVQEVYEIRGWYLAGATLSTRGDLEDDERSEFVGSIAPEDVRRRYRYRAVRSYLAPGAQNPITYVNCSEV